MLVRLSFGTLVLSKIPRREAHLNGAFRTLAKVPRAHHAFHCCQARLTTRCRERTVQSLNALLNMEPKVICLDLIFFIRFGSSFKLFFPFCSQNIGSSLISSLLDSLSPRKAKSRERTESTSSSNSILPSLSPRPDSHNTSRFSTLQKSPSRSQTLRGVKSIKDIKQDSLCMLPFDPVDFSVSPKSQAQVLHFYVIVERLSASVVGEICEFRFSIYSHSSGRFLSEPYIILVDEDGPLDKNQRLFIWKQIQLKETDTHLAVLVTIHRRGKLHPSKDPKKKKDFYQFKRPVGAATFNISNAEAKSTFLKPLSFYAASDSHWPNIAELLKTKEKELSLLKNVSAAISVQAFPRDQFKFLNQELKNNKIPINQVPILHALTLPESFSPTAYERNDMCLTLIQGDFGANDKVQICVELRDSQGKPYEVITFLCCQLVFHPSFSFSPTVPH